MDINDNKFFGFQILAISIIWIGMTIFFKEMARSGVIIYYVLTSWLLFLIVVYIRNKVEVRKNKKNIKLVEKDEDKK